MKSSFRLAVRSYGIQPGEFWKMRPEHLWWLASTEIPKAGPALSFDDIAELRELLNEAEANNGRQ